MFDYNSRMGMKVTEKQGLFCVEMDAASPTSTYNSYIKEVGDFVRIKSLERVDMVTTLYSTISYNTKFGIDNAFAYLDELLSFNVNQRVYENFILPH